MILVDNTQIILSSIFSSFGDISSFGKREDEDITGIIRHVTLNSYLSIKKKFGSKYGKRLIICNDAGNSWRRDLFPHYKAKRSQQREENAEYWNKVFDILSKIRKEVEENLDDISITVERCEADDIIGVLAPIYAENEKVLIVSNDKDFKQLLYYKNIDLYSVREEKMVDCPDPTSYLMEHILKGDSVDGIPNIMSDDDALVKGIRQKPMTAKRIDEFSRSILQDIHNNKETQYTKNFTRNQILIDLIHIPTKYKSDIRYAWINKIQNPAKNKLFNYFMESKLTYLMQNINEF